VKSIGLGAFAASELDKVFSGYQPSEKYVYLFCNGILNGINNADLIKMIQFCLRSTQLLIQGALVVLSQGIKWLTTHLHLLSRLRNMWSYTSTLPIRFHGVVLN
jgi:hypothetical protein